MERWFEIVKRERMQTPYIELSKIDRFFGITKALQKIDLQIFPGEVIGLVGPNGAGKSTLMKILTGVLSPTNGKIIVDGSEMKKYTTKEAKEVGIACAYQDLSLCTNLSVYENFAMLNVDHGIVTKPGWRKDAKKETKELLEKYFPNNNIDVMKSVERLTLAERQIVEICKTLMTDNLKVLVLDEPTSALSTDKAEQLHKVVEELSAKGTAVIYISHKLDEILKISDRIVMMRNGKNSGECNPEEINTAQLVEMLGGSGAKKERMKEPETSFETGQLAAAVKNYTGKGLYNINMHVNKGEIVGISGLAGSGQTELLNILFDSRRYQGTEKKGVLLNTSVSYVSGDRAREGVFHLWDIFDNTIIGNLDQVKSGLFLNKKKSEDLAQIWYDKLKFKAEGIHSPIMSLSGGNQQKALIARGIASGADLIILNDPTAGVDIETKQEIYGLLTEAKKEGKAVILYSTEDAEIEICDRAYIMHEGEITEELKGNEITVSNIVKASFKDVEHKKVVEEKKESPLHRVLTSRVLLPVAAMILMILINAAMNPRILSYMGMRMLVSSAVPLVFAALGQMFIVTAGDVDMGNGYSIALVNVLVGIVLTGNPLWGVVSLLIFVGAYALMGALIHIRNIPAIVVTLGAQFVWWGIALVIAPSPGGSCPEWLLRLYKFNFPIIPMPIVLCMIAGVGCWYVLFRAKYGMILRGIGNNPLAVERSGWSYVCAKMTNYALAGLMVVFSGMAYTAVCMGADANSSATYCMMSIATVILGGCEMAGGIVAPIGVVCGGIAMSFITTILTSFRVDSNYQTAVIGVILIVVLAIKLITHKKEGK